MNYYGSKIEGITFSKFKELYKERLDIMGVYFGVSNSLLRKRTLEVISRKTFEKKGDDIDWYISRKVFDGMLKELGINTQISSKGSEYREEYEQRLQTLLKRRRKGEILDTNTNLLKMIETIKDYE